MKCAALYAAHVNNCIFITSESLLLDTISGKQVQNLYETVAVMRKTPFFYSLPQNEDKPLDVTSEKAKNGRKVGISG